MAKIYAKASRVIVWLGETADNSDQALKAIRVAAAMQHTNLVIYETYQQATLALSDQQPTNSSSDETNREAILSLLDRKWFQRIGVSGSGQHCGKARLIRGAAFRQWRDRDYSSRPDRFALNTSPLSELLDMYHTHKAIIPLNKVYALLGMSFDDPYAAAFEANNTTS